MFFHVLLAFLFALSDSSAMSLAQRSWGVLATIQRTRSPNDTYWITEVGMKTPQCKNTFTAFGTGSNTWDDAFADVPIRGQKITGSFAGTLMVQASAWDNVAVASMAFYVDGSSVPSDTVTPAPSVTSTATIDTTMLTMGIHVLCIHAADAAGNIGLSDPAFFSVDQGQPTAAALWVLNKPPLPTFPLPQ